MSSGEIPCAKYYACAHFLTEMLCTLYFAKAMMNDAAVLSVLLLYLYVFSSDVNSESESESEYFSIQSHVFACAMRTTDRFSDPALGLEDMAGSLKCVKIIVYRKTLVELMLETSPNPKARWSCVMTHGLNVLHV